MCLLILPSYSQHLNQSTINSTESIGFVIHLPIPSNLQPRQLLENHPKKRCHQFEFAAVLLYYRYGQFKTKSQRNI